ncbi:MAG TPA: DUF5684 domain-containing protein [Puia sp.]|nr:DUF5684 domain-containing protein [Puia sp.]
MFLFGLFELAIIVLYFVAFWKIAEKAGRQGWEGIIPIYNIYVFFKIGGKPGWWLIFILLGPLFLIWWIWGLNMISKSFGKDEGFTVGLVLLGFVFWPILAFSDSKYIGPFGDPVAFKAAQTPDFDFDKPVTA